MHNLFVQLTQKEKILECIKIFLIFSTLYLIYAVSFYFMEEITQWTSSYPFIVGATLVALWYLENIKPEKKKIFITVASVIFLIILPLLIDTKTATESLVFGLVIVALSTIVLGYSAFTSKKETRKTSFLYPLFGIASMIYGGFLLYYFISRYFPNIEELSKHVATISLDNYSFENFIFWQNVNILFAGFFLLGSTPLLLLKKRSGLVLFASSLLMINSYLLFDIIESGTADFTCEGECNFLFYFFIQSFSILLFVMIFLFYIWEKSFYKEDEKQECVTSTTSQLKTIVAILLTAFISIGIFLVIIFFPVYREDIDNSGVAMKKNTEELLTHEVENDRKDREELKKEEKNINEFQYFKETISDIQKDLSSIFSGDQTWNEKKGEINVFQKEYDLSEQREKRNEHFGTWTKFGITVLEYSEGAQYQDVYEERIWIVKLNNIVDSFRNLKEGKQIGETLGFFGMVKDEITGKKVGTRMYAVNDEKFAPANEWRRNYLTFDKETSQINIFWFDFFDDYIDENGKHQDAGTNRLSFAEIVGPSLNTTYTKDEIFPDEINSFHKEIEIILSQF